MTVSAVVDGSCRITSPGAGLAMAFGTVDVLATGAIPATPTFSLQCSRGERPVVRLSGGRNRQGGVRRMRNGTTANYLAYSIRMPSGVTATDSGACAVTNPDWTPARSLSLASVFAASGGVADVKLCGYVTTPQPNVRGAGTPYTDVVRLTVRF
jgi:spore coat protein U-like protein